MFPGKTPDFAADWPGWAQWLLDRPLAIAVILVCAVVLHIVVHRLIRRVTRRMAAVPTPKTLAGTYPAARKEARVKTVGHVFDSIASVVIWVLAISLVLERCGVNVGLIATSVGLAGLGFGLGAQAFVKDVLAGLFMIIEDQYGIGDTIDIGPATGEVVGMTLRVTTLRDADGVLWYVPNGQVTRIGNQTQHEQATGETTD
ncbi:MAG: mechanosensitive ion channel family protein [Bifidobacteriaceae bacterium]|jgi:small conductance mechanosensitive channel|nr:mechanosensitive ion channel family protein [Bifidobacteriaceae bacterium]